MSGPILNRERKVVSVTVWLMAHSGSLWGMVTCRTTALSRAPREKGAVKEGSRDSSRIGRWVSGLLLARRHLRAAMIVEMF
jgi:hypothetical protein